VGSNNVGKSTICEALDLALGPDRLNRSAAIDEFDFYNAQYLKPPEKEGDESTPIRLRIEVVLIEPSEAILTKCGGHLEFWHVDEKRLLVEGEADKVLPVILVAAGTPVTGRRSPVFQHNRWKADVGFSSGPSLEGSQDRSHCSLNGGKQAFSVFRFCHCLHPRVLTGERE